MLPHPLCIISGFKETKTYTSTGWMWNVLLPTALKPHVIETQLYTTGCWTGSHITRYHSFGDKYSVWDEDVSGEYHGLTLIHEQQRRLKYHFI